MSRFDEIYAKTHPVVEETENIIRVESAVEDFNEDDVEETVDEVEGKEGEEGDGNAGNDNSN